MLDKNNDPCGFTREMGTVPLFEAGDEVAIAKRMEARGA